MPNERVAGLDISNYGVDKAAGLVAIQKVGAAYAVAVKQFNIKDGKEVDSTVVAISRSVLSEQKAALQTAMDNIDIILAELDALDLP